MRFAFALASVAVATAITAGSPAARAGSPFYELTEAQKRKIVVPYIRELTGCIARVAEYDREAVVRYRAGTFADYLWTGVDSCPTDLSAMLNAFEGAYGEGEGRRFLDGPYRADLQRAVLSLIRPQLFAKIDEVKRQEEAVRQAEARRQAAEDAQVAAEAAEARQREAAAIYEAEKQRAIAKPDTVSMPNPKLSVVFKRDNKSDSEPAFDLPPPPSIVREESALSSVQDDLDEYAIAHHTSSAEIVRQTGMSAVDISDYIESGKRGGQTPDQVISGLLLMHVVSIDQNTSKVTSLGVSDMPKIVDTYKKNEMRFVRDFKGRHFEDDMAFANARQNLIISGSYTVIFGQGGFGGNLTCETSDPKQVNVIADWDKGDRIRVSGDITDVTFGDVQLIGCTMQHR